MSDFLSKPITAHGLANVLARHLAAAAAVPTVAAPAALLPESLPGIAVGRALRRLGGNVELVRTSLLEFRRDYAGMAAELERALGSGDTRSAARIVHTLKGVAANLAMADLEAAAAPAEKELVERGVLGAGRLEQLARALATAVASCATLQPAAAVVTPRLSRQELGTALAELQGLAARNDFRALALLQRCEPSLRDHLGADAARGLADALAGFNFARAREHLADLMQQLAARPGAAA